MFHKLLKDKYLKWFLIAGVAIFLLSSVITINKFIPWKGPVIIHFDVYNGIDIISSRIAVFGILVSFAAILLINFLIAEFIYGRERFLSYVFCAQSLILSIFILISIGVIVSVN